MSTKWTAADIPDQSGRVAVVTGANTGLGYWTAEMLADKGAHVVLAVRNLDKGKDAVDRITANSPNADVALQQLDLTSLDEIRKTAEEIRAAHQRIDLLINNAGVMYTDKGNTKDGFELQFGTNHLGHFAFTGLLLDRLLPVRGIPRGDRQQRWAPHHGRVHFDDLQWERSYNRVAAYGQSKLSNLLFTYELQRRLAAKGAPTVALAAHPGGSDTELIRNIPRLPQAGCRRGLADVLAERRDGRAADAARGDRPVGAGRPVLRSRRPRRAARLSEARQVQREVTRRDHASAGSGRCPRS